MAATLGTTGESGASPAAESGPGAEAPLEAREAGESGSAAEPARGAAAPLEAREAGESGPAAAEPAPGSATPLEAREAGESGPLAAGESATGKSEVAAARLEALEALPAEGVGDRGDRRWRRRAGMPEASDGAGEQPAAGAAPEADTSGPASARIPGFGPCQGAARSQVSGSKGSAMGVVGEASESGVLARAGEPGESGVGSWHARGS